MAGLVPATPIIRHSGFLIGEMSLCPMIGVAGTSPAMTAAGLCGCSIARIVSQPLSSKDRYYPDRSNETLMNFDFTDEQKLFADAVRKFAMANLEKDSLARAHD